MSTEIIITGTGCPIPSATDAGPGVLVIHRPESGPEVHLQFDAGRSTTNRLIAAGSGPGKLSALFLTHHHSDHTVGVQDIVLTRWVMDRTDGLSPLPIVAPEGPSATFARRMLDVWADDLDVRQEHSERTSSPLPDVQSFDYPETVTEVWRGGDVVVSAGQVRHEPVHPAVGYRIETPDGVVAISGDTLVCDEVAALADGADVLVYEAMRFSAFEGMPRSRTFILDYHADTLAIGPQAAALGVKSLVLTHLIPPPRTNEDRATFVEDIRAGGYDRHLTVAQDLDGVELRRGNVEPLARD